MSEISKTAIIEKGTKLGENIKIGDFSIIHSHVQIEDNVQIGTHCNIGYPTKEMTMGIDHSKSDPKLTKMILEKVTKIGKNCVIRSGTIIYNHVNLGKQCSTGHNVVIRENTEIGLHCVIGSNSVINGYSKIGDYSRINTTCALPQSTVIGKGVFIAPMTAFSDNKTAILGQGNEGPIIEDYVRIGVGVVILPKLKIGSGSLLGSGSLITKDVEPMSVYYGTPAQKKDVVSETELQEYKKSIHNYK